MLHVSVCRWNNLGSVACSVNTALQNTYYNVQFNAPLSVKGLKLLKNTHYKSRPHSHKSHKDLLLLFSLHPPLIPLRSIPVFFFLNRSRIIRLRQSGFGAGPALPRCKVEMLMLIKSFIWFRLISVALLLSWAVANQIRAERRAEAGRWIRREARFEVRPPSVCRGGDSSTLCCFFFFFLYCYCFSTSVHSESV